MEVFLYPRSQSYPYTFYDGPKMQIINAWALFYGLGHSFPGLGFVGLGKRLIPPWRRE